MRYFCTYFDHRYLTRGLLVYESLRRHCPAFKLWALCLDELTHRTLASLALPDLVPLPLEALERADPELAATKLNRTPVEYYFTCTPSLPLHVLNEHPAVDLITYLDADLYFFASPEPLFEEMAGHSIAIISHRYSPELHRQKAPYGIYNVGWLSFRRDACGLECLRWWRERCLEWCYQRVENGRYCDQKYLDDWPTRFDRVVVLEHRGANVALWNVGNSAITWDGAQVRVDGTPLIFFHFHSVRNARRWLFHMNASQYGFTPRGTIVRRVLTPYVRALQETERRVRPLLSAADGTADESCSGRHAGAPGVARDFARSCSLAWQTAGRLLRRDCMLVVNGHLVELPTLSRRS